MNIETPPLVAANIEHFTGRVWVLPPLLRWLEESSARFFILTGEPGTGKSMLMAWLAGHGPAPTSPEAQAQLARLRSRVAAAHFCRADSRNIAPKAFAETMARQLTSRIPGFGDALSATLSNLVHIWGTSRVSTVEAGGSVTGVAIGRLDLGGLAEEVSFDRAFRDPLKKLYEGGYAQPVLLLIDALDEAQVYTGTKLVQLLARLADLPAEIRFIVTTRVDPRVLAFFHPAKPLDLVANAPTDLDDVRHYVAERVAGAGDAIDAEHRGPLVERLSQAAARNFLYAYFVLNNLLARLPDVPDPASLPLPDGLSNLYHDFIRREMALDEDCWYQTFRPLLGLLGAAREPGLTRSHLEELTGMGLELALRVSKQFLNGDLPDGPFHLFHRSFVEFLFEDQQNVDYHVDPVSMHGKIANYYLALT